MDGISFDVEPGEIFGFLGPNGAGKTTTIKMLCTLAAPTAGSALVAGYDIVRQRADVRRNIGLVFQDPTLDAYLTAEQNLRFHAELYGMPKAWVPDRMREVLEMVGLWERRAAACRRSPAGCGGASRSPAVSCTRPAFSSSTSPRSASIRRRGPASGPTSTSCVSARRSRSSSPPTTWTRPRTATASRSWTPARSSCSTHPTGSRRASAPTACRSRRTTTRRRSPRCATGWASPPRCTTGWSRSGSPMGRSSCPGCSPSSAADPLGAGGAAIARRRLHVLHRPDDP